MEPGVSNSFKIMGKSDTFFAFKVGSGADPDPYQNNLDPKHWSPIL